MENIEKKPYVTPEIEVIELVRESPLLVASEGSPKWYHGDLK